MPFQFYPAHYKAHCVKCKTWKRSSNADGDRFASELKKLGWIVRIPQVLCPDCAKKLKVPNVEVRGSAHLNALPKE